LSGGRVSRHKLTSYRASLVEVLRAQVKSQRLEPGLQGVLDLVDSVALKVTVIYTKIFKNKNQT